MMLVACGQSFSHGQSASKPLIAIPKGFDSSCRINCQPSPSGKPMSLIRMSNFDEESALMAEAISRVPQTSCP